MTRFQREAVAAGWVEALEEDRPAGPNLRQHAWPSRTPSPIINLLRSLRLKGVMTVSSNWVGEGNDHHRGEFLNEKADRCADEE